MRVIKGSKLDSLGVRYSPNWEIINLRELANEGKLGDWTLVVRDPAKCMKGGRIS